MILANTLSSASYLNCINSFETLFLAYLTVSSIYKVKVIKTLPQFENQFDLLQPKHKVSKVEKKRAMLCQQYKEPQRSCALKRCQAGVLCCVHRLRIKRYFQLQAEKIRKAAASIITTLQLTHHRKNRLAETSFFSTQL